eukprot:9502218-Pyramimonas_sp.AAC.2
MRAPPQGPRKNDASGEASGGCFWGPSRGCSWPLVASLAGGSPGSGTHPGQCDAAPSCLRPKPAAVAASDGPQARLPWTAQRSWPRPSPASALA